MQRKDSQSNGVINGERALLKAHKPKSRPLVEITSVHDLTFENFLDSDMNKFCAKIIGTDKKVFAPKDYIIEILISNIPPFKVPKTYNEFKAFYKALKQRFTNIPWPDFPSQFGIFSKESTKKEAFDQILQNICSGARLKNKNAKTLLAIFYAFFLDKEIINKIKQSLPAETVTPKTSNSELDTSNEIDSSKLEGALEKSIVDFERKYIHVLDQKATDDMESFEEVKETDSFLESSFKQLSSSPNSCENKTSNILKNQSYSPENNEVNPLSFCSSQPPNEEIEDDDDDEVVHHRRLGNASDLISLVPESIKEKEGNEKSSPNSILETPDGKKGGKKKGIKGFFQKVIKDSVSVVDSITDPKTNSSFQENASELLSSSGKNKSSLRLSVGTEKEARVSLSIKSKKKDEDDQAPRRRARGVSSSCKEIPNFSGPLYMKFSSDDKWTKYFARISGNCLALFKSILENTPLHSIPLYRCNLKYLTDRSGEEQIEFWHPHDSEKVQIRSNLKVEGEESSEEEESDVNIGMWYEQIKIVSEKVSGLQLLDNKYNPIGKFQVVVYAAHDIKGLSSNSSCYIKLNHPPYNLSTSKVPKNENMKWKQSFLLPIFDQFFPISFELVCAYNDGWLNNNQKEEVIATGEILVADIMSLKNDKVLNLNLPLKYTEAKLKTLGKTLTINDIDSSTPNLEVRIKNLSSFTSFFAPPCDGFVEGVKISDETMSKQLMKLSMSRAKRIATYLALQSAELQGIFNFKYPFFSYICILLFSFMVIVFEIADIIPNFILILVLACIYHHPKVHDFITGYMVTLFFKEKHLNPHYVHPRVKTYRDLEIKKLMNTERWKYKLVDPESLVSLLKKFKHLLVEVTVLLTKGTGFFEKIKNLVTWQDPIRTLIFIGIGTIGYCVLSVISFRFLVLLGIWGNFAKGVRHYKNMYKKNKENAEHALRLILKENYIDLYPQIFGNLKGNWPSISNFNTFETKIVEKMKERLNVNLPDNILRMENKPINFIAMIATCGIPLKLKMSPEEEASLHIYKEKAPKFGPKNIINFIMNTPSDYYRVIHPRAISLEQISQSSTLFLTKEKNKEHQD